ncbi:MAG: VanZ family protein [Propionicimonas sp.]|uniref:VanZ family protein n=1 Tax=Propionicimonas sp. TaxID=1955623 RepID=UPI002B20DF8C|nr:VanZ family protein [Propionicimonas sp.]MEA4944587.1 VanZ family protein [Propionicimonas sp.]
MIRQFGTSTIVAILIGGVLAVAAFLPMVAVRYRRAGRLRLLDVVTLLAVAVYAMALWSYTLIPLPESDNFRCVAANLDPLAFLDDIRKEGRPLRANRALFQAAFNVVLFLPLGYFLRVLWRRGVVIATLLGFGISAAIEFTQRTGIWGLYHCAYRVFDVDDLILNTSGALLGSILAAPIAWLLRRSRPVPRVDHVTLGRRLVGMLADLMVIGFLGAALVVVWRTFAHTVLGIPFDDLPWWVEQLLAVSVPAVVEGYWVLRRGRTLGEAIVQLQPVARPGTELQSRILKFIFGVGGWMAVSASDGAVGLLGLAFGLATLIAAWRTSNHRGLSHLVAQMDLEVEHPPAPSQAGRT